MALEDEIQVGQPIVERGGAEGAVAVDQTDFERQPPPVPPIGGDDTTLTDVEPAEEFMPEHAPAHDDPIGPTAKLEFSAGDERVLVAPDGTPLDTEEHQSLYEMTDAERLAWCVEHIIDLEQKHSSLARAFHRATGVDPNAS